MSDFTPKTRLEKILCGVATTAKTRIEKAVAKAIANAGGGESASNAPLEATATVTEEEGKPTVITLDRTAKEVFSAAEAGKNLKVTVDEVTIILPIEVFKVPSGESCYYVIKSRCDLTQDDTLFYSAPLMADTPVVLTEATGG